jgi:hypothetical protein
MSYYFKFNTECPVCTSKIMELEEPRQLDCFYCHDSFITGHVCTRSHFICDRCSNRDGWEIIKKYCKSSMDTNPLEMAQEIMTHMTIEDKSPHHHILVPAVLTAAVFNTLHKPDVKAEKLDKLFSEAVFEKKTHCNETGVCGAAASSGRIIEMISDEVQVSIDKWKFSNYMAANAVYAIADYMNTHCCKRDVLLSIKESVDYIAEHLKVYFMIDPNFNCKYPIPDGAECDDNCPFKYKKPTF